MSWLIPSALEILVGRENGEPKVLEPSSELEHGFGLANHVGTSGLVPGLDLCSSLGCQEHANAAKPPGLASKQESP